MGGHCFCPPTFQDPGGGTRPPFFGTLGGKFLCAPPKKWGDTKSAKPKVMGGNKFHDLPPHFPPFSPHIHDYPPIYMGGEAQNGWGGNFPPPKCCPPFLETRGGKYFVPPHRDFRGGEIFSWGETANGGKKASMVNEIQQNNKLIARDTELVHTRIENLGNLFLFQ